MRISYIIMKNCNNLIVILCSLLVISIVFLSNYMGRTINLLSMSTDYLIKLRIQYIPSMDQQKAFAFHAETINRTTDSLQGLIQGIQINLNFTQKAIENRNTSQALTFLNMAEHQLSTLSNTTALREISTQILQSIISSPTSVFPSSANNGIASSNYGSIPEFHQNSPLPSPEPNLVLPPPPINPQQSTIPNTIIPNPQIPQSPTSTTTSTTAPQAINPQQSPTTSNPILPAPVPISPSSTSPQTLVAPLSPTSVPPSSSLSPSTSSGVPPSQ